MRAVNLLPSERRGRARQGTLVAAATGRPLVAAAAVVVVATVAGVAFVNHSASSRVSARKQQLEQLEATLARTPKTKQAETGAASDAAARLSAVEAAAAPRTTWDGLLGSVSRVIPEDIWLDSLSMTSPGVGGTAAVATGPTVSSAPAGFVISGYTYSHPSVARLMRRLALVPWLTGISLVSSERSELERRTVYKFSIGASVQSPGAQS